MNLPKRVLFSILCFLLTVVSLPGQDLDSIIDSTPPSEVASPALESSAGDTPAINWEEIIFDEPLTAAQVFASQTFDLQTLSFSEGLSPLGILIQLIKNLGKEFGGGSGGIVSPTLPGTGSASMPMPPTIPATPASGSAVASGSGTPGSGGPAGSAEEFTARAQEIIAELKAKGAKPGTGIGDSPAKMQIGGFPSWFGELQSLVLGRRVWTDLEERGRKLLGEYADRWGKANLPQPTPHGLTEFFKYLGCCETNDEAIRTHDASLPRSGDFFGGKGGVNWCAFASNKAYMQPMMNAGFKFQGDYAWANDKKYIPQYGRGHPKFSVQPGDYISNGTHVMTVMKVSGGKVTVVSGNAGGGPENGAGTVRIEEINEANIQVVKKHSDFTLEHLQSHADDDAWLKEHGISRK